jgi:hypothetical protein
MNGRQGGDALRLDLADLFSNQGVRANGPKVTAPIAKKFWLS